MCLLLDARTCKSNCRWRNAKLTSVERLDISRKCADNVNFHVPQAAAARAEVKATSIATPLIHVIVVDRSYTDDLIALTAVRVAVVVVNVDI